MRHLRIIRLFWATSLAAEMEYRLNFAMAAITSVGNFAGSVFALYLVYRQRRTFEGWTWEQALLVMAAFTFLDGVAGTWLQPNLNRIVEHVRKGTLDFILLKPVSAQFWLSMRNLSPWGMPSMVVGVLLAGYAGSRLGLGAGHYAVGAVAVGLSVLVLYALWFILGTTTIWFVKIYNVTEVLRGLMEAGKYPVAAYPVMWRFFFTFVMPVAFLTTFPAEAMLLRGPTWGYLAAEAGLAAALLGFAWGFWRVAMRYYTGASG